MSEDPRGTRAGSQGRGRHGSPASPSARAELEITLEEAFHGSERQLTVERPERCPQCNGDGQHYVWVCDQCRGDGYRTREIRLTLEIPAGIRDGQTVKLTDESISDDALGETVLIDVSVADHDTFEREGDDIRYELELSPEQAATGETVTVPTLDGDVSVAVPARTEHGAVFRLEGKGMPRLRERGRGDQYVHVSLEDSADDHTATSSDLADDVFVGSAGENQPASQGRRAETADSSVSTSETTTTASEAPMTGSVDHESPTVDGRTETGAGAENGETADTAVDSTESSAEGTPTESSAEGTHTESERIEQLESALTRTRAEFKNYKKRSRKHQQQLEQRATEDLVTRLLDVRDNLNRALEEDSDDVEGLREGVELTLRQFDRILEDEQVTILEPAVGTTVDHQRHEVVNTVSSDEPAGTILEVFSPGYEMADTVLQPAQVVVSEGS